MVPAGDARVAPAVPSDQFVVLGVGLVVILAAWVPLTIDRRPISLPIVLVTLGVAVFALPWFRAPDPRMHLDAVRRITEVGVLVALLGAGISIDRPLGIHRWGTTWRLLSVGMVASIAGIALAGWWFLDLEAATAVLLGAVLAPTDPVLAGDVQVGEPALEERRLDDEDEVRFGLTSEAGGNDGLAFPFVHLALVMAAASRADVGGGFDWFPRWLVIDLAARVAIAVAVGWLFGRVLGKLVFDGVWRLPPIADENQGFVALGIIMAAYGSTEVLHGYGFLAVFLSAVFLRRQRRTDEYHRVLHRFAGEIEQVVSSILLVLLGGAALTLLEGLRWQDVATAVAVLLLIRPLSGQLAMVGSRIRGTERRSIAFFGIRGMGSIYYLAYATTVEASADRLTPTGSDDLWPVVTLTILLSIAVHGVTATGVMQRLDRRRRSRRSRSEVNRGEMP